MITDRKQRQLQEKWTADHTLSREQLGRLIQRKIDRFDRSSDKPKRVDNKCRL